MKAYYHGYIIERDEMIDTEFYYIYKQDGSKFTGLDGIERSIDGIAATFTEVIKIIENR
jgi:hypothetical protein